MKTLIVNIRPLSDAQARQALRFLTAQHILDLHKDSIVAVEVADDAAASIFAYQADNGLPPAFVCEEEGEGDA